MNEKPRAAWKVCLAGLALGIVVLLVVYGSALKFSNDLRFIYLLGAVVLFLAAWWLGRRRAPWLAAILLIGPLVAIYWSEVLMKIPGLWPNVALWLVAVIVGLLFARGWRNQSGLNGLLTAVLLIGSIWYCGWYAPKQLANSFTHFKDESAPSFVLKPVSNDSVPIAPQPGKILVVDFFSTTCAPCMAELPEIVAARRDLADNSDVDFVLVASDLGRDTPEGFRAFAQRRALSLPLAFDVGGKAHDGFALKGVPALVVLDRTGRVRFTHEGYNPAEKNFRADLVQLIKTL